MAVYRCRRCEHEELIPPEGCCPACGGFYRYTKIGVDSTAQGGYSTMGGRKVKSAHQYLSTGNAGFDKVLGGGLVAGRVVLLGGAPGAGKTRMLLTAADYIAKTQGVVIYASGEESTDQLEDMCAQLGLVNDRVILMGSQMAVDRVLEHAKKVKAFLVIWDSAQKFASDASAGSPGSQAQCKAIGEMIKSYCGDTKTVAIMVNQLSGSGDLKGGTELEHHCDTIMVLAFPKDDDEDAPTESKVRVLAGSKNRVGAENQSAYFKMHGENDPRPGTLEHIPPRSRLLEDTRRGRYARRGEEN